jgi:hypothetical protein
VKTCRKPAATQLTPSVCLPDVCPAGQLRAPRACAALQVLRLPLRYPTRLWLHVSRPWWVLPPPPPLYRALLQLIQHTNHAMPSGSHRWNFQAGDPFYEQQCAAPITLRGECSGLWTLTVRRGAQVRRRQDDRDAGKPLTQPSHPDDPTACTGPAHTTPRQLPGTAHAEQGARSLARHRALAPSRARLVPR